ncbi:MAG: glycerol kinase GlpK [Akkermansiaceae bacterium]
MAQYILSLDQGTSSSRTVVFDKNGEVVAVNKKEFTQIYPEPGLVEHDAEAIWQTQLGTMLDVMTQAGITAKDVAGIGITNQRETVVVWDRATGKPIHNAIVWQDRRTAKVCQQLKDAGVEKVIRSLTGLNADPYFSATKIRWILDNVEGARDKAKAGKLCLGTIDSWLIWNLTRGKSHVTDASNASRTLLYNIHTGKWDDDLLEMFCVPRSMLPEIVDSSGEIGKWSGVPISGIAGDQQAALFGQGCFKPGQIKNTYGTGCFMLMNTDERIVQSNQGLLSTVAWQLNGKRKFALEGSVFMAGAIFGWLRDGLKIVKDVYEFDTLAKSVDDNGGVVFVPAFTGIGAPHWDPFARASIQGMTRGTTRAHICRAALEAVSFQSTELLECIAKDSSIQVSELRVDGGACISKLLMRIQADQMQCKIVRPKNIETTAFGAAALAALGVGFWESKEQITALWQEDVSFSPSPWNKDLASQRKRWDKAVERSKHWAKDD